MLNELTDRIYALADELRTRNYEGSDNDVREVLAETRETLAQVNGELGDWEHDELEYAGLATNSGFLLLALVCAAKAVEVSQLPPAEYRAGYHHARRSGS